MHNQMKSKKKKKKGIINHFLITQMKRLLIANWINRQLFIIDT